MRQPDFSTTRNLIKEKPACFDSCTEGLTTLLKTPDSEHKIAEGGLRLKGLYKSSSEEKPLITVVTVVYNGAEFLEDTIKSVIEQTYDNVEYIIVDGGSTDGTLEIIRKYEDAIDYWVSEPDKGIYDAMNKGIDLANGDWVGIINSDDLYVSDAIRIIVDRAVEKKEVDIFCGTIDIVDRLNMNVKESRLPQHVKLPFGMYVNHPATFVKRDIYNSFGKYDSSLRMAADYKFFLSAYIKGFKFCSIKEKFSLMRDGGISINNYDVTKSEEHKVRKQSLSFALYTAVMIIKKVKSLFR